MSTSCDRLIQQMMGRLFVAEERRLNLILTKMNRENKRHCEIKKDGFLYNGEFFMPTDINIEVGPGAHNPLRDEFHDTMEEWIRDRDMVKSDRIYLKQVLFKLLDPCTTQQHIRDTLPDCVLDILPEVQALSRRDEPAWTIAGDERAMRQYQKYLPRMEFYSAARLFY